MVWCGLSSEVPGWRSLPDQRRPLPLWDLRLSPSFFFSLLLQGLGPNILNLNKKTWSLFVIPSKSSHTMAFDLLTLQIKNIVAIRYSMVCYILLLQEITSVSFLLLFLPEPFQVFLFLSFMEFPSPFCLLPCFSVFVLLPWLMTFVNFCPPPPPFWNFRLPSFPHRLHQIDRD